MKSLYQSVAALFALTLIFLTLAACGGGTGTSAGTNAASASDNGKSLSPSAAPTTDAKCREIKHPKGTACVPAKPTKTLVLLSEYADYMLAIGETPYAVLVTTQYDNKLLPYLESKLPNVKLLKGGTEGVSMEAILALQPDLIIADITTAEKAYDSLAKIAPTVVLSAPPTDPKVERWETDLQKIAEVFGKPDGAKQALASLNQSIETAKASIAKLPDKKVGFIRVRDKELQLYGSEGHPLSTLLYAKLGLQPASLTEKSRIGLSQEKIPELGADYLFLQTDGVTGEKYLGEISSSKLWENVPAVKNKRTFTTEYWIYLGWGVLGQQEIVRQLMKDLGQ